MTRLTTALRARPPEGTRMLVLSCGVLAIGKGVFMTSLVVYLLQVAHLSTLEASACVSAWGIAAALAALPAGLLIDRLSARSVGTIATVAVVPLLAVVGSTSRPGVLLPVMVTAGGLDSIGGVARRAALAGRERSAVASLAWTRATSNAGFAVGALVCIPLLAANSQHAYQIAYAAAGITYLPVAYAIGTATFSRRRRPPDAAGSSGRLVTAAALAGSTAILSLHVTLLDVALPIWIVKHTSVPVSALGGLVLINTVLTILGQVPVSARAARLDGAVRCTTRSALWVAATCCLFCASAAGGIAWQLIALVAAVVTLTMGELLQSAGEWGLSALLAGEHEHGFYQGACVFGGSTQSAVGPVLVGGLLSAAPIAGWGVLIVVLMGGRQLARTLTRQVDRPVPNPSSVAAERRTE